MQETETGHFANSQLVSIDGRTLPTREWLPSEPPGDPAPPKAVIIALHGFNDHNTAFDIPAEIWRQNGIVTIAYDQRGFGANPDKGLWAGRTAMVEDLSAAVSAARLRFPGVPVYALGESMGGAVVLDTVAGHVVHPVAMPDGVILVAPAVWARRTMEIYERVALWVGVRLIPSMTFTGEDVGVLASDNIPMLRELGRDPLFIKETRVDAIYGLANLMDDGLTAGSRLTIPTLLMYGANDQVIPCNAMKAFVRELPPPPHGQTRIAYYPHGWHMLLRDLDGVAVANDVVGWIADHDSPLPSGADRDLGPLPPASNMALAAR